MAALASASASASTFLLNDEVAESELLVQCTEIFERQPELTYLCRQVEGAQFTSLCDAISQHRLFQFAFTGASGVGKSTLIQGLLQFLTGSRILVPSLGARTTPYVFQYELNQDIGFPQIILEPLPENQILELSEAFLHDYALLPDKRNLRLPTELFRIVLLVVGSPQLLPTIETVTSALRGDMTKFLCPEGFSSTEQLNWINNGINFFALRDPALRAAFADAPFPQLVRILLPLRHDLPPSLRAGWKLLDTRGLTNDHLEESHLGGTIEEIHLRNPGMIFLCGTTFHLEQDDDLELDRPLAKFLEYIGTHFEDPQRQLSPTSHRLALLVLSKDGLLDRETRDHFNNVINSRVECIPAYRRALRQIQSITIQDIPIQPLDAILENVRPRESNPVEIEALLHQMRSWAISVRIVNLRALFDLLMRISKEYVTWYQDIFSPLLQKAISTETISQAIFAFDIRFKQFHSSTIRAAMNRNGGWTINVPNLFGHELRKAIFSATERLLMNWLTGQEPKVRENCRVACQTAFAGLDSFLFQTLQAPIQSLLTLRSEVWSNCRSEYGKGRGYTERVASHLRQWLSRLPLVDLLQHWLIPPRVVQEAPPVFR